MYSKILSFIFSFLMGCTTSNSESSHYVDEMRTPLVAYEPLWQLVNTKLKNSCPDSIIVKYPTTPASIFHAKENTILINPRDKTFNHNTTLAHVTAHLCLYKMFDGALRAEELRFIDEGIASIIGAYSNGTNDWHRSMSLVIAKRKIAKNTLTFSKVQKWREYFGVGTKTDFDAYYIGASFIYFIDESFGVDKRFDFLKSIQETKKFEKSVQETYGLSLVDFERQWKEFVVKNYIPQPPKVLSRIPADNSQEISTGIKELIVEFDRPMQSHIFVLTRCNDGICYKNSEWRTESTLVLKVDKKLMANHIYKIELGTQRGGPLTSLEGIDLPITSWTFKTKKAP